MTSHYRILMAMFLLAIIGCSRPPDVADRTSVGSESSPAENERADPSILRASEQSTSSRPHDSKNSIETVADYLTTREALRSAFKDWSSPVERTTLHSFALDWLALGVDEPIEQRLALAQVLNMDRQLIRDPQYFESGYRESVKSSLRIAGLGPKVTRDILLGEKAESYALNFFTSANDDLSREVNLKLIRDMSERMEGDYFSTEMASQAARTLIFVKADMPPEFKQDIMDLKRSIIQHLDQNPSVTASLQRNIKLVDELRRSHERVGKMIRSATLTP